MARITYDSKQALEQVQCSIATLFEDSKKKIIEEAVCRYREELEDKMPAIAAHVEHVVQVDKYEHEITISVVWKEAK
jgi:hypothetical protein